MHFISSASHEFRTPLSIINTNLYLIGREQNESKKEQRLVTIQEQANRVNRLLDLMMMMVKLDSGESFTHMPVNLNAVLSDVINSFSNQCAAKSLVIQVDLAPHLPPVLGDAFFLAEALRNIVQNAILYSHENGTLSARTDHAGKTLTVQVKDTGMGIAPEDIDRIFERFFRADDAHTTEGFGLGLSVAQAIIERHGGRIAVESTVGVGSTFTLVLPSAAT